MPREWLLASVLCTLVISLLLLQGLLRDPDIVQDDVRQHVFWIWRYFDATLLPNDLLADYFQSVAPLGYKAVYRSFAAVGIDPILASKLLPIPLVVIGSAFCFQICWQIFPVPLAGFLAANLFALNQLQTDDVLSATPRAFLYPLFLAFLYYRLRFFHSRGPQQHRAIWGCNVAIALLGCSIPR